MLIVGFCNLKGGVGKTTACLNLAVALTQMKKKVAVIDMDPQSNLTFGFGVKVADNQPHLIDFLNGSLAWDDVVVSREGVDIVPSTLDLVMLELADGAIQNENLLKDVISQVGSSRYDYIFCDCPPQLGIFTRNVFVASDCLFVPLEGGFYAMAGLRLLNQIISLYHERLNPGLKVGGVLMTRHNPNIHMHREVCSEANEFFQGTMFDSFIRQNVSLVEASSVGTSIFSYAPKSKAAEDYRSAAKEFAKKIKR